MDSSILFNGSAWFLLAVLLGGLGVPLWMVWKWRGGWAIAACIPAAVLAAVIVRIVIDTKRDPTSHNLWPFELIMFSAMALAFIGVLTVARRFLGVQP